MDGANFFVS